MDMSLGLINNKREIMDAVEYILEAMKGVRYAVRCNYCRIGTTLMKNEQDAIELWNHREEVTNND